MMNVLLQMPDAGTHHERRPPVPAEPPPLVSLSRHADLQMSLRPLQG